MVLRGGQHRRVLGTAEEQSERTSDLLGRRLCGEAVGTRILATRRPATANERESPTWLQNNPNLTVSKPRSGKIGTIHARVVDIGVSDGAVNDDPQCPAKACANFLRFPQWGEPYGIAGKWISRFYLSDVRYGGQSHLFVAVIEVPGKTELNAFLPSAGKLISTVRVPASQG